MILLVRVDERLIHGQVVVGWHGVLNATVFVVVDDGIVSTDWERELVVAGVPEGTRGEVHPVSEAVRAWESWHSDAERRIVLFQDFHPVAALVDAGVTLPEVNVGGLHQRRGRREFLSYVYLDEEEVAVCVRLCAAGVRLEARNVPSAGGVDLCRRLPARERKSSC